MLGRMAAKTKRSDLVQFTVRVPPDVAETFERIVADEDRTVAAELRRMIRQRVEGVRTQAA